MATAPALPELDFEAMSAEELLRWAAEEFGDKLCLTCSWQRQSSALVHMVSELGLNVDVVELDTLVLFEETYATRDRLVERYGPEPEVVPADRPARPALGDRPRPLLRHPQGRAARARAAGYGAWITGIRREQSPTRANAQKVEWSERYGVWKIQPLVDWDSKRVQAYLTVNEIPYNPLHDRGLPLDRVHPLHAAGHRRRGRASGPLDRLGKLECGIHGNAPLIKETND